MAIHFNYADVILINNIKYTKAGYDVSFPNGIKLVRAIYSDGQKQRFIRDENYLQGLLSGVIKII